MPRHSPAGKARQRSRSRGGPRRYRSSSRRMSSRRHASFSKGKGSRDRRRYRALSFLKRKWREEEESRERKRREEEESQKRKEAMSRAFGPKTPVWGSWMNGVGALDDWFPATVVSLDLDNGTVALDYDDGDKADDAPIDDVRPALPEVGTQVLGCWLTKKGAGRVTVTKNGDVQWYRAEVTSVDEKNMTINIKYKDNDVGISAPWKYVKPLRKYSQPR